MKRKNEVRGWLVISLLIFSVIIVDQVSKFFVNKLGLNFACNKGIAFGIGRDATLLALAVLVIVFGLLVLAKERYLKIAFALVFAGGLSNFIDRLLIGCVRDFVKVGSFPAFNLADATITIGVMAILLVYLGAVKVKDVSVD